MDRKVSFVEAVERARQLLERNGRLSLRALKREFALDVDALVELAEELVDVQRVAAREGGVLVWTAASPEPRPAALAEEPAADGPAAERRQLTVLFCDLVDSTRLAAGMEAEDWRALVQRYHAAAGEAVARFEGHVASTSATGSSRTSAGRARTRTTPSALCAPGSRSSIRSQSRSRTWSFASASTRGR